MTHTSTEQLEALMKLADDYAEACFDQALHQRTTDDKPEAAREKLEKELRHLHSRVQELEAQTAHMADLVELANYATEKLEAAQVQRTPLSATEVSGLLESAGYWPGDSSRADFINGIRYAEMEHNITQEKQG